MYFYGIDVYYIVLVVPALVFAMWAQMRVSSAFNRYSQLRTGGGLTGADAARLILDRNGLTDVAVELTEGRLSDPLRPAGRGSSGSPARSITTPRWPRSAWPPTSAGMRCSTPRAISRSRCAAPSSR